MRFDSFTKWVPQYIPNGLALQLDSVLDFLGQTVSTFSVNQNFTLTATDKIVSVQANATTAALTIYLPVSSTGNRRRTITKTDVSVNTVTIDGNGNLINGALTIVLTTQYDSVTVEPVGTEWFVVASAP